MMLHVSLHLFFSKSQPSGPIISISLNARVSVCLSVRHTFIHSLNVLVPPLSEVQYPKQLDFRNPWGKVMERSGLKFENFCS